MSLLEYQRISDFVSLSPRHPWQLNALFASDAELLRLPSSNGTILAVTTDGISEEIEQGLYGDPFTIGWMTVMANLSDLAAVGAQPIGLLIELNLTKELTDEFLSRLREGVSAACHECGTYLLGGDMNNSALLSTCATAIGQIRGDEILTRKGCQAGDALYTSFRAGVGAAYAFQKLFARSSDENEYRPIARLREGALLRTFASACIDTSDGLIPGLAQLGYVNDVGFEISAGMDTLLHSTALELAIDKELPPWIMLAGPHGDFELLFTLPIEREYEFLNEARAMDWHPIRLGSVRTDDLRMHSGDGRWMRTKAWKVANLFEEAGADPMTYLEALTAFDKSIKTQHP